MATRQERQGVYVFVVCGAAEHIETLHVALPFLRQRTQQRMLVVTDSTRNQIPVQHPDVVDVATPSHLDHHQASIWLKTSLHRLLPQGPIYLYLDTDVLAIGSNPDCIFEEFIPPIRFAADHCRIQQFSPHAVLCGCLVQNNGYREKVAELLAQQDPLYHTQDTVLLAHRAGLQQAFAELKKRPVKAALTAVRFFLARGTFRFTREFHFDKKRKVWVTPTGVPVMYDVNMRKIARTLGLKYSPLKSDIQRPDGHSIWNDRCGHLAEFIHKKWGITVADADWQHWNGGVFLFGEESTEFMDTWHRFTVEIFADETWKTRDQGTLIASAWAFGLARHPMLAKKWNYIADYHNPKLQVHTDGTSITSDGQQFEKPEFIHVYHHFGDTRWSLWNWIMTLTP